MVFLIINIITLLNINNPIDGNLIGEHISEIDIALVEEIDSTTNKKIFKAKENINFLGKQFDHVSIQTSLNDTIESIYIGFRGTIEEKGFLSAMISEYGEPKMYNIDVIKEYKEHLPDKNGISSTTFKASTKECTFNEQPLFILWNKGKYTIKLNIAVESRTSIVFKKISNVPIDVNIVGKHIDSITKRTLIKFDSHKTVIDNQSNSYVINEVSSFLDLPVTTYFITTDSNDHIKKLSFSIPIIEHNLNFFDKMSKMYGEPIDIYCMDNFIWGEESTNNGISTQESKGQFNKCAFIDDPYLIRWKYNDLYIEYVKEEYSPELKKVSIYVSFTGVNLPRVR